MPVMRTLRSTVVAERCSNVKLVCNGNNVQPLDTTLKWTFNTHKMKHNGYRNIKIVWRPERQAFYSLISRHTEYIYAYHSGFWLFKFLSTDASTLPVMYSLSSTVTAVRGSNVTLVCKGSNVQQLDTYFMWKFNNETVKNKENRNIKLIWLPGKHAKCSLDILNVSDKDVGDYRCIAQVYNFHKIDKAEASIKLRLYESSKYNFFTFARFISKRLDYGLKWSFARVCRQFFKINVIQREADECSVKTWPGSET